MPSLICPYCDKPCSSKPGLTNHMKCCPEKPDDSELDMSDARDVDPRDYTGTEDGGGASFRVERPRKDTADKKQQDKGIFGAFYVMMDHVPIFLDLNFCAALADHILTHGSDNRAILAFGHQLQKAAGDG